MLAVLRKEMTETLRDRRTLVAAVILPAVTMPLVVLAAPALLQRQQQAWLQRPIRVAPESDLARTLADAAAPYAGIRVVDLADPHDAVLRGEADAALAASHLPGGGLSLVVRYDESRPGSAAGARRLAEVLNRPWPNGRSLPEGASGPPGPPEDLRTATPVVTLENLATPERMGAALLATVLPLFVAVWLLLGGQYAALDVGVGERERGTLESLLAAPAARSALVWGKFLAVLGPALLALAVVLLAGAGALSIGGRLLPSGPVRVVLPMSVILPLGLVGAALGTFLSAAQLIVSLTARTLREAQQAFTGLYLVIALPAMLVPLVGEGLDGRWISYVPVVNAVWTIQRLLAGDPAPGAGGATAAVLAVLAVLLLGWGAVLLARETRPIRR